MKGTVLKFCVILLMSCCTASVDAQSKIFENVISVKLQNTVTIKNNNTIVGYAFFYQVDKMKRAALYRLEILDENLKSIGSNEFEGSKELYLEDALYESDHIMLVFNDIKKTDGVEKFVKVFDLKGKETGMVTYDPEKVKKGMFGAAVADQMENYYNGNNNVEGKGFVTVHQSKAKTGGADIQMITTTGKLKWEQSISADKGDRMDLYLASTTPNALIFFSINRDGIMARDSKNFLIGLSPDNGKELFRKSMEFGEYAWEPMLFKTDGAGSLKMISTIYHEDDKFYTGKPIGFNIASLNDKTGDIKLDKNFLFESDLSSVLNMKNESKAEEGYIKMHDICLMPDGSKVLVGEFFRKTVSAMGTAMKILSRGSASAAQVTIGDMFLLRIDKNNKPLTLEKVEKDIERIPLPTDGMPIGLIARVIGLEGNFGYLYTDENSDPSKKTVLAYGSFEGEKFGTVAINFDDKKGFKVKRFNIEKEKKERVWIKRGKPGHVMVQKYNPKEKKITVNLERVD
jgi:hypothetical protein